MAVVELRVTAHGQLADEKPGQDGEDVADVQRHHGQHPASSGQHTEESHATCTAEWEDARRNSSWREHTADSPHQPTRRARRRGAGRRRGARDGRRRRPDAATAARGRARPARAPSASPRRSSRRRHRWGLQVLRSGARGRLRSRRRGRHSGGGRRGPATAPRASDATPTAAG